MSNEVKIWLQVLTIVFQLISLSFLLLTLRSMKKSDKILGDNLKRLKTLHNNNFKDDQI